MHSFAKATTSTLLSSCTMSVKLALIALAALSHDTVGILELTSSIASIRSDGVPCMPSDATSSGGAWKVLQPTSHGLFSYCCRWGTVSEGRGQSGGVRGAVLKGVAW